MKKETFYKISIAILIVLNLLQLGAMLFRPKPHQDPKANLKNHAAELMQLNNEQKKGFFALVDKHKEQIKDLQQKQNNLTDDYFHQPKDSILTLVSTIESEKIKVTEQHFMDIERILNDNQKPYFEKFKNKALQQILQPHPPKRPPHPDGN